jgi:hypothetical protein
MTHRKSLTLVTALLFAVSLAFASSAAALPRCPAVCTITCPCETPCILFGTIVATCAEFACGPPVNLTLVTVEEFPILEVTERATDDSTLDVSDNPNTGDTEQVAAE